MKNIHVECLPDELLVRKIGFTRRYITHHQGKSRIFHALCKNSNQLALVDEDPGSPKTSYEKSLKFNMEAEGIKCYSDNTGNKIFYISGKLEEWIINICSKEEIKLLGLVFPVTSDDLHDQINQKLDKFDKLLSELLKNKNRAIEKLRVLLK